MKLKFFKFYLSILKGMAWGGCEGHFGRILLLFYISWRWNSYCLLL